MLPANISLYLGAAIEEESERATLASLLHVLAESAVPTVIFANVHIGGRQLDFVVARDQLTVVIEAKGAASPLRGSYNGDWEARTRVGRWRPYRNAYLQALEAKLALRDAMRARDASLSGYPNACVLFVPGVPAGSDLPAGDHKVSLCDIGELGSRTRQRSGACWRLDNWHAFAAALRLERPTTEEMALDADLLETQKTLDRYSNAFDDTYGPVARTYIADSYRSDDHDIELAGVESLLLSGQDLLVLGPSGCGKSLLATCLAHRLLGQGVVPIVIECKLFDGALGGVLQQEAVLLEMHSAPALIAAARRLSRPILLVADGYNECQEGTRVRLTRTLRAASIRYDAMILVTSQVDVARSDLLQLQSVIVDRPGGELKERIAGVDAASHSSLSNLLDTVATGFEANLVGQVGRELRKHSSRFALFDYFARRKLGDMATDGIRLSCAIAKQLLDRLTFSLSVREVDRISAAAGAPTSALQQLGHAGVLSVRGDRVSFGHEIYVHAFAAEAILREKGTDAGAIATALAEPRYASARTFLAGAIDDDDLLTAVVSLVADRALLEACLLGECGSAARRLVSEEVDCMLSRLTAEAASLRFSVTADGWWNVELDARYVASWSQRDLALVSTLSVGMAEGQWINQVLETLKILDSTLAEEFRRLRPTAAAKGVNIRSGLFAITYALPRDKTGLCHLVNTLHNGSLVSHRRRPTEAFTVALHAAWPVVETPGQLYVALSLCRLVPYERKAHFAPYVLPFLQGERWSRLPYHVHLDLLDFVHALYDLPEHLRNEYVDALQALLPGLHPFMTQTAVEALQRFGALQIEEEEQTEAVREEIRAVLSQHAPENAAQRAWGIYNAQFDHPLAGAYVQALEELPASDLRRLQMLACEGADVGSFFLSSLFDSLGESKDPACAAVIKRFAQLPAAEAGMPQYAIDTFIAALIALGRLRAEVPDDVCCFGRGIQKDAMLACGLLYYWLQRRDRTSVLDEPEAAAALNVLLQPGQTAAAGALYAISTSIFAPEGRSTALVEAFPNEARAICREALNNADVQAGYFDRASFSDRPAILDFAVAVVGRHGSAADLPQIRKLRDHPQLARSAAKAVQSIEARGVAPPDPSPT